MRTVTRAALRTRIQQRSDTVGDQHTSTTILNDLINECARALYDELVNSGPPDFFRKSAQFTSVSGTTAYDLTSASIIPSQDFYKLRRVYGVGADTRRRVLDPATPEIFSSLTAPQQGTTIIVEYVPRLAEIALDGDTIPDVHGWSEAIVLEACIKIALRKSIDPTPFAADLARVMKRIRATTPLDVGTPPKMVRTRLRGASWSAGGPTVTHYRLEDADTLELWQSSPVWP